MSISRAGSSRSFYERDQDYTTIAELLSHVREHPIDNEGRIIPVCIWGARGIGKTAQIRDYCTQNGYDIRIYHPAHDTTGADIIGEKQIDENGKVTYALPSFLPVEGDPNTGEKGVLFIDEINRAPEDVLAGLMEVIGEGGISQSGWQLPKGWQIVTAANPSEVGYLIKEMDSAMVDRMLHYNPGWDASLWAGWANKVNLPTDFVDFVMAHPHIMDSHDQLGEFQLPPKIEDSLVATARSGTYFAWLYEPGMPEKMIRTIGFGLLGREATEEFLLFIKQSSSPITPESILSDSGHQLADGRTIYAYEGELASWRARPQENQPAITGTCNSIAAYLSQNPPETAPGNQLTANDQHVSQMFGRFIALLPSSAAPAILQSIRRSAGAWHQIIEHAYKTWLQYFIELERGNAGN